MKDLLVYVADGFEEIEMCTIVDIARRADLEVDIVSMTGKKELKGAHDITVVADELYEDISPDNYRAYFTPGGMPGSVNLRDDERVTGDLKRAYDGGREIFAICAAPIVLEAAGLLEGKKGTSFPGFSDDLSYSSYEEKIFVHDGQIHTSRGPATAIYFAVELVSVLKGEEAAAQLKEDLLLNWLQEEMKAD